MRRAVGTDLLGCSKGVSYLLMLFLFFLHQNGVWGYKKNHFVPNSLALELLYSLTGAECFSCTLSVFSHALIKVSNLHTCSAS